MVTVSVIIPTYGGGHFLERAIDSVLAQDYLDIEIIVVDDNGKGTPSQLRTQKIMEKYLDIPRIKYIVHDNNKNGAAARNTGFKHSTGKYIAFLDDDDVYLPSKIRLQVQQLEALDEEWSMCYCSHKVYKNGKLLRTEIKRKSGHLLFDVLTHKVTIGSTSLLIRRSVYEKLGGFDESFKRHQDWEFTARVANMTKIVALDYVGFERYLTFRNSPKSLNEAEYYMEHYLKKMEPLIKKFNKWEQKYIIVSNRLSILLRLLRKGKILTFIKKFNEYNAGLIGLMYLLKAIISYVYRNIKQLIRL